MLLDLRRLNIQAADSDDLVVALALAEGWAGKYVSLQIPVPDWLPERVLELTREIKARNRDRIQMTLRQKKMQLNSLKTMDEKKVDLTAEIAKLEEQLAG